MEKRDIEGGSGVNFMVERSTDEAVKPVEFAPLPFARYRVERA